MYLQLQPSRTLLQCLRLGYLLSLGVLWLLPWHVALKLLACLLLMLHWRAVRDWILQAPRWLRWDEGLVELDGQEGYGQILPRTLVTPFLVLLCVQFERRRVRLPIFHDALSVSAYRGLRLHLRMRVI